MLTLKRLQARIENQFLPRDVDHIGGPIVERNTTTRVKTEIDSPIVISSSLVAAAACESSAAMTLSQKESWTIETQIGKGFAYYLLMLSKRPSSSSFVSGCQAES